MTSLLSSRARSWISVVALCAGCSSSPSSPDAGSPAPDSAVSDDASTESDAFVPPDAFVEGDAGVSGDAGEPPSAEFVALYETVLVRDCGGESCHMPGSNTSSYFGFPPALQMPDAATARAVLVGQTMECMSSPDARTRVVPFDPAASAIMLVAEDGLCGRRHNVVIPATFTATELGMIESWIASGAL